MHSKKLLEGTKEMDEVTEFQVPTSSALKASRWCAIWFEYWSIAINISITVFLNVTGPIIIWYEAAVELGHFGS